MIRRRSLSVFLMFVGITIVMFINFFNKELNNLKENKDNYIQSKNEFKEKIKDDFKEKIEELTREQMRLNLNSTKNSMESMVELFDIDMTQYTNRINLIKALTSKMYFYDKEGDTFTINNDGYFDLDDSSDCGQPTSLIEPSLPLLDIKNRKRTFWDETAWQYEISFILYSQGLINHIPKFILNSATEKINPIENYSVDNYLNDVKIFKTNDLQYIEIKYPKVFKLLKKYKVIMHSDYSKVENVVNFFNKQIDTDENTKLSWQFNPKPYVEILEMIWIPSENGFNGEHKNFSGGSPNPKYVKIGLVQGTQIQKIFDEYRSIFIKLDIQNEKDIKMIENMYENEKRNIEIMAFAITILFVIVCFSMIQIILRE